MALVPPPTTYRVAACEPQRLACRVAWYSESRITHAHSAAAAAITPVKAMGAYTQPPLVSLTRVWAWQAA